MADLERLMESPGAGSGVPGGAVAVVVIVLTLVVASAMPAPIRSQVSACGRTIVLFRLSWLWSTPMRSTHGGRPPFRRRVRRGRTSLKLGGVTELR